MSDSKYKIQIEIDKQSTSETNQSIKTLLGSFTEMSKTIKPLSDSISNAFSPKTLETITKMSSALSGLDRVLESLSGKVNRFGSSLNQVAGSKGFQEIKGFAPGTILDANGNPIGGTGSGGGAETPAMGTSPVPPRGGNSAGGGGMGSNGLRIVQGIAGMGGGSLGGIGLGGLTPALEAAGPGGVAAGVIAAALASFALGQKSLAKMQNEAVIAQLQEQRFGVQSALQGQTGEYGIKNNIALTAADQRRISITGGLSGIWGGVKGFFGDALTGHGIRGITTGYTLARDAARAQEALAISGENVQKNQETVDMTNRLIGYAQSTQQAERVMGTAGLDRNINGMIGQFGLQTSMEFVSKMAARGVNISGGAGMRAGLERNLGAGAISERMAAVSGTLTAGSNQSVLNAIVQSGIMPTGTGLVAMQAASQYAADMQAKNGMIGSPDAMAAQAGFNMSFTGAGLNRGLSPEVAAQTGQKAAEMRQNLFSGNISQRMVMGGVMSMGLDGTDAMVIDRYVKEGRIGEARAYGKNAAAKKGLKFDDQKFSDVVKQPMAMRNQVEGMFRGQLGFIAGGDVGREASRSLSDVGALGLGGTPLSSTQRRQLEGAANQPGTRADTAAAAAREVDHALVHAANTFSDIVVKAATKASEELNKRLQNQIKAGSTGPSQVTDKTLNKRER